MNMKITIKTIQKVKCVKTIDCETRYAINVKPISIVIENVENIFQCIRKRIELTVFFTTTFATPHTRTRTNSFYFAAKKHLHL